MRWKPNVTVAAIVERDQKFLLVEENADNHIVFNQPAGHLEQNETLIEAISREVLEETAWEFIPKAIVGVYMYPNQHSDITYLRFCFSGTCDKHHPEQALDDGIIQAVWLSKEEIKENKDKMRSPMVAQCINDYLTGKNYPLNLINSYLADKESIS
ncbi:MAG: NUDIX hydrolase [Gammaproteobacteria bacterium]|nr:MAG: NUDIX hydrolase [Gammaproteobacteria bacterium]RKZ72280.1 MAG: NUDIX hydrolase [Gammaproteobacteria bacterium]